MAYYGTIVGKKSVTENLTGTMSSHGTRIVPYPEYDGSYVATPTSSKQYFPTTRKSMMQDFTVNETPYARVSNPQGGYTVTIL